DRRLRAGDGRPGDRDGRSAAAEDRRRRTQPVSDRDESPADDAAVGDEPVADEGETLFYEPGGSWWVVAIGPVMLALTIGLELYGGGPVHWQVWSIFGAVLIGFSVLQVAAARKHVSVRLTERTLRQGTRSVELADIAEIYP